MLNSPVKITSLCKISYFEREREREREKEREKERGKERERESF